MLSSISPLGERARASRWWLTTTAYVAGSLVGGAVVGVLAALLGALVPATLRTSPWLLLPLAAVLVVTLALDLGIGGRTLPVWKRQVDVAWLTRYRGWVYGLGFGAQLGFGVVTIVTSATTYAMVAFAALSGHVVTGLVIGATFGLVRSAPSVLMAPVRSSGDLHRVFGRLERLAAPADWLARAALAGAAAGLVIFVALGS
jgi:hypothetical protein